MDPFSTFFSSPVLCAFKPNLPLPVPVSRSSFGQKQWQRCPITTTFALGFQWYSSSCSTLWACLQWSVWQKLWSPSSWICSRRSRKNEVTNSSKILDKKHKSYWIQNKNFELTVWSKIKAWVLLCKKGARIWVLDRNSWFVWRGRFWGRVKFWCWTKPLPRWIRLLIIWFKVSRFWMIVTCLNLSQYDIEWHI